MDWKILLETLGDAPINWKRKHVAQGLNYIFHGARLVFQNKIITSTKNWYKTE